jgi:hypothetical protein
MCYAFEVSAASHPLPTTSTQSLPQDVLFVILNQSGADSIAVMSLVCKRWNAALAYNDGCNHVRQCTRCYTLDHGSASHDLHECIRRANPKRKLFGLLDMKRCCVAGGYATTLVREIRFPHSKREHLLIVESMRERDVDVFIFPGVPLFVVYRQLRNKLDQLSELRSFRLQNNRVQLQTRSLGVVDMVANRDPGPRPSLSNRPAEVIDRMQVMMNHIVAKFDFDACRVAMVYFAGLPLVVDLDFGRPYGLCCYCHNEKLKARVTKYEKRGHTLTEFNPLLHPPRHFACAICLHTFTYCLSADEEEGDEVSTAIVNGNSYTRSCCHGPCTQLCMRHVTAPNPLRERPNLIGHQPPANPRFTRLSSCCWISPCTQQDSDPFDVGPVIDGLTGRDRRNARMQELNFYHR